MSHGYVIMTLSAEPSHDSFGWDMVMTRTLHDLYDSHEYPYESYLTHKYLCYSHMSSCMLSHIPISTRMIICFCVNLIGLCNQVSSLIFWL